MKPQAYWVKVATIIAISTLGVNAGLAQPLAFASDRNGGRFQIFTADASAATVVGFSQSMRQVTNIGAASQQSLSPSWSIKAGRIVFQFGAPGVRGVHSISAVGGPNTRLTPLSSGSYPCTDESDPAWSQDANFIAYTCTFAGKQEIWIHPMSGSPEICIVGSETNCKVVGQSGKLYLRPVWSPDSSKLAFVVAGPGSTAEISLVDLSLVSYKPLTTGGFTNFDPSWSPDGLNIAFSSIRPNTGSGRHILRMSVQCPEATLTCPAPIQITTSNANDTKPAWSPDATSIAFTSDRSGKQQIYLIDPTTRESSSQPVTLLSDGTANDETPAWEITPPFTIVDPVPDLVTDLLSPSSIPSQTLLRDLAQKGRLVNGVSADGVARLVLRIPAASAGQQFRVDVVNDLTVSSSPDEDGGVAPVGSNAFDVTTTVTADLAANSLMAFVVYRAPLDFHRANQIGDDSAATRTVSLVVTPTMPSGPSSSVPLTIVRPPVVLVHGWTADASAWKNFQPLIGDTYGRFSTNLVEYHTSRRPARQHYARRPRNGSRGRGVCREHRYRTRHELVQL